MSILASTQGTPERVWSLIAAITASGGSLERAEASDLLNPCFLQDGQIVRDDGFNQTLGAATSLGAVEVEKAVLRVNPSCAADDYISFSDWVHDRLVALDEGEKDAVLLQTYAWMAVVSQREGSVSWSHNWTNSRFADAADEALPEGADDDGNRRINSTKLPSWRRWLTYLGLLVPMPLSIAEHPAPDARLTRILANADIARGVEMPVNDFLEILKVRLPYLDGGSMFLKTAERVGYSPPSRTLSPMLSAALRHLNDDRVVELRIRGDASDVVQLSEDPTHTIQSFHAIVVNRKSVA